MKLVFLGTGTSHGIPMIGCSCPVCMSSDPHDKRTRCSALVKDGVRRILIDASYDFRQQALREHIDRIDAVLLTHAHADHTNGLDDLRPLSFDAAIPVYGQESTLAEIRTRFSYCFEETQEGGGKPKLDLRITTEPVLIGATEYIPIPLKHGELDVYGWRFGNTSYLTDCSKIPEESFKLVKGTKTLVIDALRYKPHSTHFSIEEAVDASERIGADRVFFVHMCHRVSHAELEKALPEHIRPAYDGLEIDID